jgi:hypothetical protein
MIYYLSYKYIINHKYIAFYYYKLFIIIYSSNKSYHLFFSLHSMQHGRHYYPL